MRQHHPVKRQRGMSMIALLLVLAVTAFLGLFAFKVGPSYLEFMTVKSIGDTIANDSELMRKPKSSVMQALSLAYRNNNLWEVKPEEMFKLEKDGAKGYIVTIDYEKRNNLIHNIDVVTSFTQVAGNP